MSTSFFSGGEIFSKKLVVLEISSKHYPRFNRNVKGKTNRSSHLHRRRIKDGCWQKAKGKKKVSPLLKRNFHLFHTRNFFAKHHKTNPANASCNFSPKLTFWNALFRRIFAIFNHATTRRTKNGCWTTQSTSTSVGWLWLWPAAGCVGVWALCCLYFFQWIAQKSRSVPFMRAVPSCSHGRKRLIGAGCVREGAKWKQSTVANTTNVKTWGGSDQRWRHKMFNSRTFW